MASLVEIEGIGKVYARKLEKVGIRGTASLLKSGATKKGRQEIARASGVSHSQVLRWVNHVDLFRVKGVSGQYAELLEASGVDSVPELAQRNVKQLVEKLAEVNKKKNLVNVLPGEARVKSWISQAKKLKRVITY